MRALPVALTCMDQARARRHDTDLTNRLTDQAFGSSAAMLSGRVVTGGRAAAIEAAGAASQIPADGNPEVYDEGFWSRVNAWAGLFGHTGPAGIVQASGAAGAR